MGGLFGGGKSPPRPKKLPPPPKKVAPKLPPAPVKVAPKLPPAPKPIPSPQKIADVIDKITGVQSITTVNSKGQEQRVIERLPRTPQEEKFYKQGEELMKNALTNIQSLYKYNPAEVANFQPFISTIANLNDERQRDLSTIADFGDIAQQVKDYKQMNSALLDEEVKRRNNQIEEDFSHRGIGNSTSATEYRSVNAKNADLARLQNNVNADMYGQELAAKRLSTNLAAFGARESGRQGRLEGAKTGYALEQQKLQDLENKRIHAIQENQNLFSTGAALRGEDQQRALMSRAPELANQTFDLMNTASLNRYNSVANAQNTQFNSELNRYNSLVGAENAQFNSELNRYNSIANAQNAQYQNKLAAYNAEPPSFGDRLLQLGGTVGGSVLNSPSGTLAGNIGNSIFGGGGTTANQWLLNNARQSAFGGR